MTTSRKSPLGNWGHLACLLFVALGWANGVAQVQPRWVARYDGPDRGSDWPCAVAPDRAGNVYVFGPSGDGSVGGTGNGVSALIKYDASGNQLWVARDSGAYPRFALPHLPYGKRFLATDDGGNAYVTGVYWPVTNHSPDIVTAKYDPSGRKLWSAFYNGPPDSLNPPQPGYSYDAPSAVTVDVAGNVYVTGFSGGYAGTEDFVTIKYDSSGTQRWVRRYSGPGNSQDIPVAIALDLAGNVHVTGWSFSVSNRQDYLTIKYDANGIELWTARYDGRFHSEDEPAALVLDERGNVFVTGGSVSSANCAGNGDSGCRDVTTVKYNAQGHQLWVSRHERLGQLESVSDLAMDRAGNLLVSLLYGPGLIKYDNNGNELWASRFQLPGSYDGMGEGMALDDDGHAYVAGLIYGSAVTIGVAKYDPNGNRVWSAGYPHGVGLGQSTITLAVDAVGRVYVAGAGESENSSASPDITTLHYMPTNVVGQPVITVPPEGATVPVGGTVTLSVEAVGQEPLHYHWRFSGSSGQSFPELDSPTITLSNLQVGDTGDWSVEVSNAVGIVVSPSARLIVNGPPSITTQPQDVSATEGEFANFYVGTVGTPPLVFQWFRENERVGLNRNFLEFSGVRNTDAGSYRVVVSNAFGSVTSAPARLTVQSPRPSIVTQPLDQTVSVGGTASFSVTASGQSPLRYQWQYNGVNLAGATAPTLTLSNAQTLLAGLYRAVVANSYGSVSSAPARLTVVNTPAPAWSQTNTTPIRIPDSGAADPSPSSIFVSGVSSDLTHVTVTLRGVQHTFAADLDILLVGPSGQSVVLMSVSGGDSRISVDALTFNDGSDRSLPRQGPISAGIYKPTNSGQLNAYFGPNAPPGPYGDRLAVFEGTNPNGRWDLYVYDNEEDDFGSVAGGWSLSLGSGPGLGDGTPADADPFALDTWHQRVSPWGFFASGVVYGANGFVAVGTSSQGISARVLTSSDGIEWFPQSLGTNVSLSDVAYGGGVYVAVGIRGLGDNRGVIFTSTNGVNWSDRTSQPGQIGLNLSDVAASEDGRFVAVGTGGSIRTSVDRGATWQSIVPDPNASLLGVTYGQGIFVAVGFAGVGGGLSVIRTSNDGLAWVQAAFTNNTVLASVAYGGGRFVAVGNSRTVITSIDGTHWTSAVPVDSTVALTSVTYANGAFVCGSGNGILLSSWDGSNWAPHTLSGGGFNDLASDGETVVGVFNNRLFQSDPLRFMPPRITRPPQHTSVRVGLTTNLSVNAIGTSPLSYQWRHDGTLLVGETNRVLVISNAPLSAAGSYFAVVEGARGAITSAPAVLRVGFPPWIRVQPLNQQVLPGEAAVFSIEIEGTGPFHYHWRRPGSVYTVLAEQGPQSFWHVPRVGDSDAGTYGVVVSNDFGSIFSRGARLSLLNDTDADGIPDVWEVQYRLNPNNSTDAMLDLDDDGLSNLREYRAGTDPTNVSSALIIRVLPAKKTMDLLFFAETNRSYTIEQSSDLEPGSWQRVRDFVAASYMRFETIELPIEATNRLFRVVSPHRP